MRSFAYCAASYERSVRRAAGVEPLLSPPASLETLDVSLFHGREFLYFKLHGLPGQPFWYGDDWLTAVSAKQVRAMDLGGAVVFVANCHLPESPMLEALLDGGARAVIGGAGENYARAGRVDGADLLGLYVRWMLGLGMELQRAFWVAKMRLKLRRPDRVTEDTLAFRVYREVDRWVM